MQHIENKWCKHIARIRDVCHTLVAKFLHKEHAKQHNEQKLNVTNWGKSRLKPAMMVGMEIQ